MINRTPKKLSKSFHIKAKSFKRGMWGVEGVTQLQIPNNTVGIYGD